MVVGSIDFEFCFSAALAKGAREANMGAAPMAPAVFKNARRELLFSFSFIVSPYN
jgi:hypothetical protein